MEAASFETNVVHRNQLLSACDRLGHWELALHHLQALSACCLEATAISYSTVGSACNKASQWQAALDVCRTMVESRTQRDTICCNVAITACAKGSLWPAALGLLRDMDNLKAEIDVVSFNAGVSSLARPGAWEQAVALMAEMSQLAVRPDGTTLGAVLSVCAAAAQWMLALELLQQWAETSLEADQVALNSAMLACSQSSQWTQALALFAGAGAAADGAAAAAAASACQRAAQWMAALSLVSHIRTAATHTGAEPFNAAISACEKGASWQAALAVVDVMEEAAVQKDVITYNSAIGACGKGGRWEVALHLLAEAAWTRVEHDRVSYYTAIQACETCGQWARALQLLRSLWVAGIQDQMGADSLDRRTYVHAFQAGDPIDCFKHVVFLALLQSLMAWKEPLTVVDCHAGSGIYDFRGLEPGYHRNFQDGIIHVSDAATAAEGDHRRVLTPTVCQYLALQRRTNYRVSGEGGQRQLHLFAGSAALALQARRPQDQVLLFEAAPGIYRDLLRHLRSLGGPTSAEDGIHTFCDDSYRWLLRANTSLFTERGVVFLDPPYDSVNSFHIWNLFMVQFLRSVRPGFAVGLWYPFIDTLQTANLHARLVDLGQGDVLVAEMEVDRPFEEQQSRSGVALLGAPAQLRFTLEEELSCLGDLLAGSPYQRQVRVSVRWLRGEKGANQLKRQQLRFLRRGQLHNRACVEEGIALVKFLNLVRSQYGPSAVLSASVWLLRDAVQRIHVGMTPTVAEVHPAASFCPSKPGAPAKRTSAGVEKHHKTRRAPSASEPVARDATASAPLGLPIRARSGSCALPIQSRTSGDLPIAGRSVVAGPILEPLGRLGGLNVGLLDIGTSFGEVENAERRGEEEYHRCWPGRLLSLSELAYLIRQSRDDMSLRRGA
ncbi:unnamed protein product [Symbiodinium natans]|uniref:Pentatricopeptide repeat-containing protein, chloroplastic n=1 Tax=Symbiodinium natans TaxID=878477 RepID=A0A812M7Y3_9DINO|nr:unnamed protein product [Symbiodinium natans]